MLGTTKFEPCSVCAVLRRCGTMGEVVNGDGHGVCSLTGDAAGDLALPIRGPRSLDTEPRGVVPP